MEKSKKHGKQNYEWKKNQLIKNNHDMTQDIILWKRKEIINNLIFSGSSLSLFQYTSFPDNSRHEKLKTKELKLYFLS